MNLLESIKIKGFVIEVYSDRPNLKFYEVNQVHGREVVAASDKNCEADGIVASKKGDVLAIKTADCLPIAFIGQSNYAHIHAGWKGLSLNIFSNSNIVNITPTHIHIGPHIKSCCFEVSEDFYSNFDDGEKYRRNKKYFDLTQYAIDNLVKHYPNAQVTVSKSCTCCDSKYNSFRRNKTKTRNYNILKLGE